MLNKIKKYKPSNISMPITYLVLGFGVLYILYASGSAVWGQVMKLFKPNSDPTKWPTVKGNFSQQEYQNMAEQLYTAMSQEGTDEKVIYSVINSLYDGTDFYNLVVAFGSRRYFLTGKTNFIDYLFGDDMNLIQWFDAELGDSEQDVNIKDNIKFKAQGSGLTLPF